MEVYLIKISIIIPLYNPISVFWEQCITSILNQTLQDIEIILIDDGSEASYKQELNNYLKKDKRIKLLNQKHKGSGPARNLGLKNASGEYIAFMDSDDYYPDTDILEHLYNIAIAHNISVVGGKVLTDNNGKLQPPFWNFENFENLFKNKIVDFNNYQIAWGYWCYIYKKEVIIKNNLFFPNYLRYQDPPWFVKTLNTVKKFYASDKVTYIYRENLKKSRWTNKKINDYFMGITDLLKFTRKTKLKSLHSFLYRKFLTYDINKLEEINPNIFISSDKIINRVLKVIDAEIVREIQPDVPVFKNAHDYRKNIKNYIIIDQ